VKFAKRGFPERGFYWEKRRDRLAFFPLGLCAAAQLNFDDMKNRPNALEKNGSLMKAVIIYDSFALAAKANSLMQSAGGGSGCEIDWEIKPWRASLLKLPNFTTEAREEAKSARLIVLATEEIESLPYWLEQWLEQWGAEREFEEAALAVLTEDPQGHLALFPQAYRFAARQGLTFIYQPHESTDPVCAG
jgi:hypothetical protein